MFMLQNSLIMKKVEAAHLFTIQWLRHHSGVSITVLKASKWLWHKRGVSKASVQNFLGLDIKIVYASKWSRHKVV